MNHEFDNRDLDANRDPLTAIDPTRERARYAARDAWNRASPKN